MNFAANIKTLKLHYAEHGLADSFESDARYLETAFHEINTIWFRNLEQIRKVNYLMLAEAPLWGECKKYIYNPETNHSQFFYRSDLEDVLNEPIPDKRAFINACNEIGLLVMDISPFALNAKNTRINYRRSENGSKKLTKKQYKNLVSATIPTFFQEKIGAIQTKKAMDVKVFFRYARVKDTFGDLLSQVLIDNDFIATRHQIGDISRPGGGIDKTKLKQLIKIV